MANQPPPQGGGPPWQPANWQSQQGAPPAYGQPLQPYRPDPAATPPTKKTWYLLGATLMLVSMALMIGGGLWLYEGLADRMPSEEDIFGKGKTTTTSFETGVSRDIFIDSSAGQHHVRCNVAGPPNMVGDVRIDDYSGSLTVGRWRALFTVTTPQRGLYTITCTGAPSDTFGVGEHDPPPRYSAASVHSSAAPSWAASGSWRSSSHSFSAVAERHFDDLAVRA